MRHDDLNRKAGAMSRLLALIDEHKVKHGNPSDASIARAIGVAPQTISSWRTRGIRAMPEPKTVRALAAFLHIDEETALYALGVDTQYIVERPGRGRSSRSGSA